VKGAQAELRMPAVQATAGLRCGVRLQVGVDEINLTAPEARTLAAYLLEGATHVERWITDHPEAVRDDPEVAP
jgi:hypothetical protein